MKIRSTSTTVSSQPARSAITDTISAKPATDKIMNDTTALTPKWAFASIAASTTDGSIVAAVTSKKIRVLAGFMTLVGAALTATFNSKGAGAGTAITPTFDLPVGVIPPFPFNQCGWMETAAGEGLSLTTGIGIGGSVKIHILYVEV